jgi:spore maturation protein CgeB
MLKLPNNRRIITHDRVKSFIPLHDHFSNLGYQVLPADDSLFATQADKIAAHFCCFYETLKRPFRASWRLRCLRQAGIPSITWNRDAPHYLNRPKLMVWLLEQLRPFDIYASHSTQDGRQFGAMNLHLPNAADTQNYFVDQTKRSLADLRNFYGYKYDVSFFGSMNGNQYKEMRQRQEFFAALGNRLKMKKISFLFREAVGMTTEDQIALVQQSRINLNFGAACDYGVPVASGLPERCFGIPACGGFLLCDKRTHASDDFTIGENWAEFNGLDDCVTRIEYWLANPSAARDIAERCHQHVMTHHTYSHRAATLHDALLAWYGRLA